MSVLYLDNKKMKGKRKKKHTISQLKDRVIPLISVLLLTLTKNGYKRTLRENGKREKLEENNLLDAHITNQVDSEIVFFSLLDQEIIFVHIRLNQIKME